MKANNTMKNITVTRTKDSLIISNGKKSVEILTFYPESFAKLQEIADRIYAKKVASRNKSRQK